MSNEHPKREVVGISMTDGLRRAGVPERLRQLSEKTGLDRAFIAGVALREGLPLVEQDNTLLIKAPQPPTAAEEWRGPPPVWDAERELRLKQERDAPQTKERRPRKS